MVPLIFTLFVLRDSFLFSLNKETVDSIPINMKIVDNGTDQDIFLLTEHEIISIDTHLTIKKIIPLPSRYFEIETGKRLTLLAADEILILDRDSLTTIDAIALQEGDYHIIGQEGDRIFLLNQRIDTKGIEEYSFSKGRRIRSNVFYDLHKAWLIPQGIMVASGKYLTLYSRNLKKMRNIVEFLPSDQIFLYRDHLISIRDDSVKIVDLQGSVLKVLSLPGFRFRKGGDLFVAYSGDQVIVFRYPRFVPYRLRISKKIDDIYVNGNIYIKINDYYLLDIENHALVRLKVPAPVATVSDSGDYLQVGAFTNPDYAKDLLNQLSAKGVPAHSFNGKIRIGPFANRQDGVEFAQTIGIKNYWVVKDIKRAITGLLIGRRRYLPIIGYDRLIIYNISDSLLVPSLIITGKYSTYLSQDFDNNGQMDLVLISEVGREIVREVADSLVIRKEQQ